MIRACLWNEWRMHRTPLMVFLAVVSTFHVLGWCVLAPLGYWVKADPAGVILPVVIALLVGLGCFAFEMLTRERLDGALAFLSRLPVDLGAPFRAKVLFLTAMVLVFWIAGPVSLLLVERVPGSDIPVSSTEILVVLLALLSLALSLSYWGIAVTCWLPGGSLALPATFLIVGAAWFPFLLMWMPSWIATNTGAPGIVTTGLQSIMGFFRPFPTGIELTIMLVAVLPLFSLLGAWLSFTGLRKGGGCIKASLRGGPVLLCCVALLWGWVACREEAWSAVKPGSRDFSIQEVFIGKGGNYAFINAGARHTDHYIVYDLRRNTWKEWKECASGFHRIGRDRDGNPGFLNLLNTLRYPECPDYIAQLKEMDSRELLLWDGEKGMPMKDPKEADLPMFPCIRDDRYYYPYLASSGGSQVKECLEMIPERDELKDKGNFYFLGHDLWLVLMVEEKAGSIGWWRLYDAKNRIFLETPLGDLPYHINGMRRYIGPDLKEKFNLSLRLSSSAGKLRYTVEKIFFEQDYWVVVQLKEDGERAVRLWDPESEAYRGAPLLEGKYQMSWGQGGWLVFPSEEEDACHLIHRTTFDQCRVPAADIRLIAHTPAGNLVATAECGPSGRLLHLDRSSGACTMLDYNRTKRSYAQLIGVPDEDTVYLLVYRNYSYGQIVKADFATGEITAVFPENEER